MFGIPLELVLKRDRSPTPLLVLTCMADISQRATNEVGVFRLAGDALEIQQLKNVFETCMNRT